MIKIERILIPTDFSEYAEQALTQAIHFAKKYQSELHILHVNTLFDSNPEMFGNTRVINDIQRMSENFIGKQINKIAENESLENLRVIQEHEQGISAAPTILEYSNEKHIDLIVMGTHGRRGLGHLFLGSVAEEVVRLSKCPVFTVNTRKKSKKMKQFKNILVPIDLSEISEISVKYAKEIAELYDSKLHLLHVIEDNVPAAYSLVGKLSIYDLVPDIEEKIKLRMEKSYYSIKDYLKRYKNIILTGHATTEIIKYAENHKIDLITIATHGFTGIKHLFVGSVAEKVVRMAPCPVFITKPFGKKLI